MSTPKDNASDSAGDLEGRVADLEAMVEELLVTQDDMIDEFTGRRWAGRKWAGRKWADEDPRYEGRRWAGRRWAGRKWSEDE